MFPFTRTYSLVSKSFVLYGEAKIILSLCQAKSSLDQNNEDINLLNVNFTRTLDTYTQAFLQTNVNKVIVLFSEITLQNATVK